MKFFSDSVILPYIRSAGYRRFCEVGVSYGEHTKRLLEANPAAMVLVDPGLDADLDQLAGPRVSVQRGLSLDVLARLDDRFDCIFLDGDHNWFTVYHELKLIDDRGLLRPGGTIFLHDVGWPYGRRDMYYQPDLIPAEHRQPYAAKGMVRGQSELVESGGDNAIRFNAVREGGPRNGVLTAVEDLMRERPGKYRLLVLEPQHGLGVLYRRGGVRGFRAWLRLWLEQRRAARLAEAGPARRALWKPVGLAIRVLA